TFFIFFFFSSRSRHTRFSRDWSSDVCSSDLKWLKRGTFHRCTSPGSSLRRLGARSMLSAPQPQPKRRLDTSRKRGAPRGRIKGRSEERRVGKECRSRRWGD